MKTQKLVIALITALTLATLSMTVAFAAETDSSARTGSRTISLQQTVRPVTAREHKSLPRRLGSKTDDPLLDRFTSDRVVSRTTEWVNRSLVEGCHAQKDHRTAAPDL
jgi:hypothetical protein